MATKYFAYVDRVGETPFRQEIFASQRGPKLEDGVQVLPAATASIMPNQYGVMEVDESDEFFDQKIRAIEIVKKQLNLPGQPPRLIGPFNDYPQARLAQFEARPKTDKETAGLLRAENEKLKAMLAGKGKGKGRAKSPPPDPDEPEPGD